MNATNYPYKQDLVVEFAPLTQSCMIARVLNT